MKKTTKAKLGPLGTPLGNPLGFFNSQKAKRSVEPKQTLKKRQEGGVSGPYEQGTSKYLNAKYPGTAMKFTGPVDPQYEADQRDAVANPRSFGWGRKSDAEKGLRKEEEAYLRSSGRSEDFNAGLGLSEDDIYKRGGRVRKPIMKKGGAVKAKKK